MHYASVGTGIKVDNTDASNMIVTTQTQSEVPTTQNDYNTLPLFTACETLVKSAANGPSLKAAA